MFGWSAVTNITNGNNKNLTRHHRKQLWPMYWHSFEHPNLILQWLWLLVIRAVEVNLLWTACAVYFGMYTWTAIANSIEALFEVDYASFSFWTVLHSSQF